MNYQDAYLGLNELFNIIYLTNLQLEFYGIVIACVLLTILAYGLFDKFKYNEDSSIESYGSDNDSIEPEVTNESLESFMPNSLTVKEFQQLTGTSKEDVIKLIAESDAYLGHLTQYVIDITDDYVMPSVMVNFIVARRFPECYVDYVD